MAILGISSSTKTISAALADNGKLVAELSLSGKEAFSEDIVLYVEKMVSETRRKIDRVAVTIGPGAYSGIRGGMAFAKTLAQVKNIKLAGVSTLHALAYRMINGSGTIGAITNACQNDYNFALFRPKNGRIERLTDDLVIHFDKLAELLGEINGELRLVGEIEEISDRICEIRPESQIIFRDDFPSGYNVAQAGEQMIAEGKISDPLKLMPKYSHTPNIREFKA